MIRIWSAAGLLQHLPLQLDARGPVSLKPGRDDDRPFHARLRRTRAMMPGTVGAGVTITARSTGVGNGGDARIGLDAQHARPLRVDREHRAAERTADQVPQDGPPDAARRFSVAPITATFCGVKKTFNGELFCGTALREALLGLMACIFSDILLRSKSGAVQTVHNVGRVEPFLRATVWMSQSSQELRNPSSSKTGTVVGCCCFTSRTSISRRIRRSNRNIGGLFRRDRKVHPAFQMNSVLLQ